MNRLKDFIRRKKITQEQFADGLGVSRELVNRIANGEQPTPRFMWKFFAKYGEDTTVAVFDPELQA